MSNLKTTVKKILSFTFRKIPYLSIFVRNVLDGLADVSIYISKWVGKTYTLFFDYLGTSWYDHRFDHLRGIRNYHWLERVFFVLPKISVGDNILDVGCGDGMYSGVFYSEKAKSVLSIDANQDAINTANNRYKADNVKFLKKNILKWEIPENKYDIVIMFSVIEHLTASDGHRVLLKIKRSLKKDGIFYGSTPIVKKLGVSNWEHKNEFTSLKELRVFLEKVFTSVKINDSSWNKDRPEGYFECRR
jgi:2-polyprenyl-3-methyl-5-hydroxy-6-metoxy-1,4-benzoquinol methylase